MDAHHLSLAKASFGVSLLRPDVTKISRDDLPTFHRAFDAALVQCSSRNIQTCKRWLFENVLVSVARTTALGKYLVTISKHLTTQQDESLKTSISRQRLHILYLVNDLLHHAKYHSPQLSLRANVTEPLQPFLVDLFQLAAFEAKPRVSRRLDDLVRIWEEEEYFSSDHIGLLRGSLTGARPEAETVPVSQSKSVSESKELPYIIPQTHGDPSLPYYDLPAGNLMRYIVPNSSQPMRTDEIRALQFAGGIADESLVNALKDFLKDVEGLENGSNLEEADLNLEIDEMGQTSYHDEAGDLVGDTYYGWSRSFCEKMKRRGRRGSGSMSRSPGGSRSRSRSPSSTRHKRSRRNDSSNGRSRSSRSDTRSPSRREHHNSRRRWSRSPSRSRSRSRSYSPTRRHLRSPPRHPFENPLHFSKAPQVPVTPAMGHPFQPQPLQATGFPLPSALPPHHPPPHWTGPWPPPPPPPPSYMPGNPGFSRLPFPPPPPLPPSGFPPPPGVWPLPPGNSSGGNNGYPRKH